MLDAVYEFDRFFIAGDNLMQTEDGVVQVADCLLVRLQIGFITGQQITALAGLRIFKVVEDTRTLCRTKVRAVQAAMHTGHRP